MHPAKRKRNRISLLWKCPTHSLTKKTSFLDSDLSPKQRIDRSAAFKWPIRCLIYDQPQLLTLAIEEIDSMAKFWRFLACSWHWRSHPYYPLSLRFLIRQLALAEGTSLYQTRHAFAFKLLGWTPFFTVRNDLWRCDEATCRETSTWDLRRLAAGKEDFLLSHSIRVLVPQRGRGRPSRTKEESFLSCATKPSDCSWRAGEGNWQSTGLSVRLGERSKLDECKFSQ